MHENLTQETWIHYLEEDFHLDLGGANALAVRLVSVTGFTHHSDPSRAAYSLLFCGPSEPILPQRTYQLVHSEMGELDVFLVPIGPQKHGMGYEAVFN